uniref:Uncharacterized protein n=1 Tax=Hemiselmis andersenii TaxID=464988 RepID=A0A6U4UC24_HEMAN|mmetsp:Transcript_6164/g.14210  ORF Transcript_6164/g.14210 Transcript_6164/m.14210 type:complete len:260 (-) Transcript_6164:150-929(-)
MGKKKSASRDDGGVYSQYQGSQGKEEFPLRPEFQAVCSGLEVVTLKTDPLFLQVEKAVGITWPVIFNRYSALAAACCAMPMAVVAVPMGVLACTVGLPIFLPVLIITTVITLLNTAILAALIAISPYGRRMMQPTIESVKSDEVLSRLFYDAGPRPSPIAVIQHSAPTDPTWQLLVCLMLDMIGAFSYLLPLLGEGFDLAWAPFQALMMSAMFDKTMPSAKWLGLAEEMLPFTDIIPSASLAWLRCNSHRVPLLKNASK